MHYTIFVVKVGLSQNKLKWFVYIFGVKFEDFTTPKTIFHTSSKIKLRFIRDCEYTVIGLVSTVKNGCFFPNYSLTILIFYLWFGTPVWTTCLQISQ